MPINLSPTQKLYLATGKRVEFAIKLPEGLLLPIDAKFPSGLFDNYLTAVDTSDSPLIKKSVWMLFEDMFKKIRCRH